MALKVLLADDNITAQKMGSKILTDAGYTVIAVSNGAAAMKKIAAEKPELIILDVYMPGYTGLEVCEKVKNAPETAQVPVVLTVTNMEPFNAEDGNRVKADGVLIKPFEATDLLAVVRKFEEKLHPAAPAEAEKTVKMAAVQDFEDESYAEWKADAAPEEEAKPAQMSREDAAAPAMGIEGLTAGESVPAFGVEAASAAFTMDAQPMAEQAPAPAFDLNAPAPAFELEHAEPAAEAAPVIAPPAELEFTSAPQAGAVEVGPAPELEVTAQEAAAEVPIVQDAALVTDPTDIAQFATKFGEEHPEDIPVGIAMPEAAQEEAIAAIPDLLAQPMPAEEASAPVVEEEMARAFETSGGAAAAAPEAGVKTERQEALAEPEAAPAAADEELPAPGPPAESAAVTQLLVAQFAAELEAAQKEAPPEPEPAPQPEMEPPAGAATAVAAPDDQHVAEAVSRVLERYKGELIAAIVRELKG